MYHHISFTVNLRFLHIVVSISRLSFDDGTYQYQSPLDSRLQNLPSSHLGGMLRNLDIVRSELRVTVGFALNVRKGFCKTRT